MDNKHLIERIRKSIIAHPEDEVAYKDMFQLMQLMSTEDFGGVKKPTYDYNNWLRPIITQEILENRGIEHTIAMHDFLRKSYLWSAQDIFVDYMVFLEWDRKPQERFYQPRAKCIKELTDGLQMLVDDKLDELFLSMPPRVGKTTMLLFFTTFLVGRDSEKSNLYCAYSDIITKAFFKGFVEIIDDPYTYNWKEVFPTCSIADTDRANETINIDRKKRYSSLTCRSLYGTLNGACDASGMIISDDLIGGIEEALNKDRLIASWSKVDNNLIPRGKEKTKYLWCGTRWSLSDPTGIRLTTLREDMRFASRRFKVINRPALNSAGESNFDYEHGVGFSSEYYVQRKASFEKNNDEASWYAQYQGEPVERSGALFEVGDFAYYNGDLPDESLVVRKFMAVDPAFGGGDFVASPIAYEYEDGSIYIVDVVYSNASKKFTQPELAKRIVQWGVQAVQFECTKSTVAYKEKVEELLHEMGYRCNVSYKSAPTNVAKEVRIYDKAPEIRDFKFLEPMKRTSEYEQFMSNVYAFRINGRNAHDDAPDSLCQLVDMVFNKGGNLSIMRRKF